ncbi:MAG: phosphoenolpyruvate carboxylase [Desulfobacteraceae bacterium]|nr:phosphoenolpyruvate carboxylase [Desulfobacteraceae bacterium]
MFNWQGFEIRNTGFSDPLDRQMRLLAGILGHTLRRQAGEEIFALAEKLVRKCSAAGDADSKLKETQTWLEELGIEEMIWLIRTYTAFFHLMNEAERQEIIRKYREDAVRESPECPVSHSLNQAFFHLKQQGMTSEQMLTLFGHLDIQPTLTAHPTEARRGSILYKQKRISSLLSQLRFQNELSEAEQHDIVMQIYRQVALMMVTDDRRAEQLSIEDDIRNSIHFCTTSIWETVPGIYADVQHAFETYFSEHCQVPVFLRYRTRIGGDQSPAMIEKALMSYRTAALKRYQEGLNRLWEEFSISSRRLKIPKELTASLEKEALCMSLGDNVHIRRRYEPYRLKISYMEQRMSQMIANPANMLYSADAFLSDLLLLERCVENSGLEDVAASGLLSEMISCVRAFGFHLLSLDICRTSSVHEAVIHELFSIAGVSSDYSRMPEYEKSCCSNANC